MKQAPLSKRQRGVSVSRNPLVGATIGRPQILQRKICRRKAKNRAIYIQKIRKTLFFGGRALLAPTFILKNRLL